jgi:YVTN family beta-propeller protein
MRLIFRAALGVSAAAFLLQLTLVGQTGVTTSNFVNFEGAQTSPIRLSPDGTRLFAVNTPDARLSVFDVEKDFTNPPLVAEIPVGIEPVSVNARTNDEVWVVNQVSDSISIVSVSKGVVVDTLQVKDEPADVVFAGSDASLAFVSASRSNEVRVFDTGSHAEVARIPLEGENPRALAVSADGSSVYVAFALSGNKTTIIPTDLAPPQPAPTNRSLPAPPRVGLIVDAEDPAWAGVIKYTMPDNDVAEISVASRQVTRYISGVGTTNLGLAVDPKTGNVLVTNTEARNLVRFEPELRGHIVDNRVTVIDQVNGTVSAAVDLNANVDYSILPNDAARAEALAQPTAIVPDPSMGGFFVAAFGTDRVARVGADGSVISRIEVGPAAGATVNSRVKRGPRGLALNAATRHLYVMNRISNTISVINANEDAVLNEIAVGSFDPTPKVIREGRGFLYDAKLSGNGTAACAACHIDADMDLLAWDLGNPGGAMEQAGGQPMHPMKGPMTTQTLRGLNTLEPFHWRGDKATFLNFNPAFANLMGGTSIADADMAAYRDYVNTIRYAPNPNRNLDNSLPASLAGGDPRAGRNTFVNEPFVGNVTCNTCHTETTQGSNRAIFAASTLQEPQAMKVPQLRNMYQKTSFNNTPGARSVGGVGFMHDGAIASLSEFLSLPVFQNLSTDAVRKRNVAAFLLAFDTGMAPSVGHTRTLTAATVASAASVWSTLEQQAVAGRSDLIVKGTINGEQRGLLYRPSTNDYRSDRTGVGPFTRAQLTTFVSAGDTLTVMGVPAGSGTRMGIDRDVNGVLDGDVGAPPPPVPVVVMSVSDITTTSSNSSGALKTSYRKGETVFWRVRVRDAAGKVVSGASVQTDLTFGSVRILTTPATTGSDGWALFSRGTVNDPIGTYKISVVSVTKADAVYDAARNAKSSTTYSLKR